MKVDKLEILEVALAIVKDKIENDTILRLKEEFNQLLECEAESRRAKKSALIQQIAKLKITLQKFESTYNLIQQKTGKMEAIDEYISSLKLQIKRLSYQKNAK